MLNTMEKVETDDKDKPQEEIKIENVTVFVDPFEEVDQKVHTCNGTVQVCVVMHSCACDLREDAKLLFCASRRMAASQLRGRVVSAWEDWYCVITVYCC